jgi:hypothetical protein
MPNFASDCISIIYVECFDEDVHCFDNFFRFCHVPEHKIHAIHSYWNINKSYKLILFIFEHFVVLNPYENLIQ